MTITGPHHHPARQRMDVLPLLLCVAVAGCSPSTPATQPETSTSIKQWGNLPVSASVAALPDMARVCAGLHYGLVTQSELGEDDPLVGPDLENVCGRSILELTGDCRAYAEKARDLGRTAKTNAEGTPVRVAAERTADDAFYRCWR